MAHYALINQQGIVEFVHVGRDETDVVEGIEDWETYYCQPGFVCKRTSYNTRGGVHILGGIPLRKNYAGIGYTYDAERDAFIPPKPFESWLLNEDTCLWDAPTPYPTDGNFYSWDEEQQAWVAP